MFGPVRAIRAIVRDEYKLTDEDMIGWRRTNRASEARRLVMWLARKGTSHSFPRIARAMHRDWSTIIEGVNVTQRRVETDPAFAARATRLLTVVSLIGSR